MNYIFSDTDLHTIYKCYEIGGIDGPSQAYRLWVLKGDYTSRLSREDDVEGFICSFYTQYNKRIRAGTF